MTRSTLTPFTFTLIIALITLFSGNTLSANQIVTTSDGREVLLKEDGSWKFRSTDRYTNTEDGRRVRLKEDGSWEYAGNAPVTLEKQVRTTDLDIKLQKVVIETHEKKVQKNKRVKTQTVFYLNLEYSPQAKANISTTENNISHIEVKDNEGNNYPVLSIQPNPVNLKPGSSTTIVIRAKGSPTWLGKAKSMEVVFSPGIFGLQKPITLSQKITDFEEKSVDGFEKNE